VGGRDGVRESGGKGEGRKGKESSGREELEKARAEMEELRYEAAMEKHRIQTAQSSRNAQLITEIELLKSRVAAAERDATAAREHVAMLEAAGSDHKALADELARCNRDREMVAAQLTKARAQAHTEAEAANKLRARVDALVAQLENERAAVAVADNAAVELRRQLRAAEEQVLGLTRSRDDVTHVRSSSLHALLETVRSERQDALAAARKAEQEAYGLSKLRVADAERLQGAMQQLAAAVAARDDLQKAFRLERQRAEALEEEKSSLLQRLSVRSTPRVQAGGEGERAGRWEEEAAARDLQTREGREVMLSPYDGGAGIDEGEGDVEALTEAMLDKDVEVEGGDEDGGAVRGFNGFSLLSPVPERGEVSLLSPVPERGEESTEETRELGGKAGGEERGGGVGNSLLDGSGEGGAGGGERTVLPVPAEPPQRWELASVSLNAGQDLNARRSSPRTPRCCVCLGGGGGGGAGGGARVCIIHTHTRTYTHTLTHTCLYVHLLEALPHQQLHTHTHTHTHTHKHTHTHTHMPVFCTIVGLFCAQYTASGACAQLKERFFHLPPFLCVCAVHSQRRILFS
jgi:hypothetical protein